MDATDGLQLEAGCTPQRSPDSQRRTVEQRLKEDHRRSRGEVQAGGLRMRVEQED